MNARTSPPPTDPWDPGVRSDIDTRTVRITFFSDETAQSLRTTDLTLSQLAEGIAKQTAASKMELPWLKLAIFGDKRSEKNCLRTNANAVQVTGALVAVDSQLMWGRQRRGSVAVVIRRKPNEHH